ncbi:AraC-like DNA-binding protein [Halanaerobium saccharolyticum]|uniref:AraC-like DNA-binding protein n=1 Tax=Halanaerobium saccharolyticum TaxID=43595 RepID=A0A4R7Z1D1_9FIRM|nr:AraC family transcriptional regulator [Halanaerobium saccharolyticum]RAK06694.1 AraC-like DNA-binding protein [Halanaerobium saccharolyticum]TDW01331.1 AraC-like DNA-binding protein [Halanaerobium saccharolyticum]TDX52799.1 AraC-like DNA-binding protein [Halanaerobium saccharolyticum]
MNKTIITHVKRDAEPFNMEQRHYHNQFEIYYLLKGERNYFINQRSYHVKKGDLVLINKNILHKTSTIDQENPEHERILIQFDQNFFSSLAPEMEAAELFKIFKKKENVLSLNPEQQLWLEEELFKLTAENKKTNTPENKLYIKMMIVEILIFIKRISLKSASKNLDYPDQKHKNISKIAAYISQNYQKSLTLSELASKFNYSSAYLSRAFKEVTGFNFVEYKNNIRIKEASKLLQQSNLSVTEIATEVGFNNITHFGRIFKEFTDLSPLEYRKVKEI